MIALGLMNEEKARMVEPTKSDKGASKELKQRELLSPKRGATPTPLSEIDKARRYVPDPDAAADQSDSQPAAPKK